MNNVGSVTSPITGPEPSTDTLFLPSTVYWYTSMPTGAVVDQQYPSNIATVGTANGFVAGLWNNRDTAANDGPVLIHGNTTAGSRYMFYNTNAFSRADGQREWLYFVQTALWSNLTDEVTLDGGPAAQTVQYSDAIEQLTFSAHDANAGGSALVATASGLPDGVTLTHVSDNGSTIPGGASWSVSGNLTAAAGAYPVTVTVADGVRTLGSVSFTINVTQENAALLYNGSDAIAINTMPTLGTQFWDSAAVGYPGLNPEPGGTIGDITKGWVRFDVRDLNDVPIGAPVFGQIADTGTVGDGIGSFSAQFSRKSSTETVWLVTTTLVANGNGDTPNLFYDAPIDDTGVIAIYQDTGQFATGGGTIPDGAGKANLGFVARYDRKGKPSGQLVYEYTGMYNGKKATFTIRSSGLTGLAFSGTTYPVSATIAGKASITIVECSLHSHHGFGWRNKVLFSARDWRFAAQATDTQAKPSRGADAFAISIWNKNNELYKSVPATALSCGNITIRNPKSK